MKRIIPSLALAASLALAFGCAPTVSQATDPGYGQNSARQEAADYQRTGFTTRMEHGRLWVFLPGSEALAAYEKSGELAKHVIRPGKGPGGVTIKAPEGSVIDAYMLAKPGFITRVEDGRLWVFRAGSPEFKNFTKSGELAKHVIRPGAGPRGMTLKAPDTATADAYMAAGN
ncbi:MAG: hypothetical protein U5J62_04560 [Desulfurivibrio sp.]|nr:hypothetical protein [Desulfurivibrio sp.]